MKLFTIGLLKETLKLNFGWIIKRNVFWIVSFKNQFEIYSKLF